MIMNLLLSVVLLMLTAAPATAHALHSEQIAQVRTAAMWWSFGKPACTCAGNLILSLKPASADDMDCLQLLMQTQMTKSCSIWLTVCNRLK
jgi:hypothetical protein